MAARNPLKRSLSWDGRLALARANSASTAGLEELVRDHSYYKSKVVEHCKGIKTRNDTHNIITEAIRLFMGNLRNGHAPLCLGSLFILAYRNRIQFI